MRPLLSILIATRNRTPYCINVIKTILAYEYSNFELVVQDNSDTFELKNYLASRIPDKRLVYNYTPPPFSSIDNFNAVIGRAKGLYLCLIGDDDAVHPEIFKTVEWAESKNISAIVPTLKAIYKWPDACDKPDDKGLLTIEKITGEIKLRKTNNSIKKLMKNGGQGYLSLPFPKLYHGIVKKKFLDLIKEETGNYVGGLSPDIYVAICLIKYIPFFYEIDYPLTLPGICGKSTPIEEKRNTYRRLEEAPHFRDRGTYKWSPEVPRFYSSMNIWADSALASLKDTNRTELLNKFNVTVLSIILLKKHKEYSNLILENYFENKKATNPFLRCLYLCLLNLKRIQLCTNKLISRFSNILKEVLNLNTRFNRIKGVKPVSFRNIDNINEAVNVLEQYLLKQNLLPNLFQFLKNERIENFVE